MSTAPRDVVIAAEQKAVNRAYDCYEARLAEMTSQSAATASASGKDSIAVREGAETAAQEYGGLGEAALVVSRVDVQETDDTAPETFYVGRRHVFDPETRDQVVISWTNPTAVRWHNARPETPGEVLLRRQLRCAGRTVEDFLDEITPSVEPHTGLHAPGPDLVTTEAAVPPASEQDTTPSEAAQRAKAPRTPDETTDQSTRGDAGRPRPVPSPRDIVRRQRTMSRGDGTGRGRPASPRVD